MNNWTGRQGAGGGEHTIAGPFDIAYDGALESME